MYDETTIEETGAHRNEPQGIMADGVDAALEKGRPRQVLVVEDESETASLIVKLLEKDFGVEAIVAENLSQAREKLLSSPLTWLLSITCSPTATALSLCRSC